MQKTSFTPFPILKTERLTLRQLSVADEQEIFILRSDSGVNKYLNRPVSNTITDARDFIHKINENINKNDSLYWAITLRDKNILVGTICLFGFSEDENECEIGYELLPGFQGQGIMREAAKKVIDYAFNTIQFQKLEAFSHRDNQASIKLLRKLSFCHSDDPEKANAELLCFHLTN